MGIIKFEPARTIKSPSIGEGIFSFFRTIYVTNWRLLGESEKGDFLVVVLHNFRRFTIENMTLQEFFDINENRKTIKKSYKYDSSVLSCKICHGDGKLDWVKKVMRRDTKRYHLPSKYIRNRNHINKFIPVYNPKLKALYGSIPYLHEGHEFCSACKGTGVHSTHGYIQEGED